MKAIGLIFFTVFFNLVSWGHGYHVSIAQVDYNEETKSLEIAIKLLTDDVEQVLESRGTERLFLGEENESSKTDDYIRKYIEQHFVLSINAKPLIHNYLGKEIENESTWCYIEILDVNEIHSLSVQNTIFLEEYHNQSNRVNLNVLDNKTSFVLSAAKTEDKITFE